ncbi:hypothetical protein ABZY44_10780 [Streptomyces sp. NPDC006544]|uniref:hypothetical protein n=1 Tax=Streptomyces sp. NPDC006544 TaxID=3154583 RepID=UPI0033B8C7EF
MPDINASASERLGLGVVGALLAGGLLLAACAAPEGRARAESEEDWSSAPRASSPAAPGSGTHG